MKHFFKTIKTFILWKLMKKIHEKKKIKQKEISANEEIKMPQIWILFWPVMKKQKQMINTKRKEKQYFFNR